MLQEQKPKKPVRKKPKPSAMTRPPKRNKKKKKIPTAPTPPPAPIPTPAIKQQQSPPQPPPIQQHIPSSLDIFNHDTIMNNEPVQIMSKTAASLMNNHHYLSDNSTIYHFTQADLANLQQQELFTVCENSSAYESSEDTGVGGLSESELMNASDGIGKWLTISPKLKQELALHYILFEFFPYKKFHLVIQGYWKNTI